MNEIFSIELKRCNKCILPETFPGIKYDDDGICNYCRDYKKVEVKGEEALIDFLSNFRGVGEKYDCIVPISGGRDSTFVLHQIVKKYNMRTLALTVDSGAITNEGYQNIDQAIKVLQVNHVWLKDEKQIESTKKNAKLKFKAWMKKPSINTIVPVLNAGDKTMNLRIFRYAHDNKIPLVIGGNNVGNSSFEQEHFKTGFLGVFPNERGQYSLLKKVWLSLLFGWEYLNNINNWNWSVFREYLSGAMVYFFENFKIPKDVTTLGFYDYIYWNEKTILSTIINELGWISAADTKATWRIDDAAYPLIDYLYYKLVGFNEFDEHYSKLIREEQITRDEALCRLNFDRLRINSMKSNLNDMGIEERELEEIILKYHNHLLKILKII